MGRRRATVEEARVREDERARADARHQRPAGCKRAQAGANPLVSELRARSAAARIDQHVERPCVVPGLVSQCAHADDRQGLPMAYGL